jgi:hypothetical protein
VKLKYPHSERRVRMSGALCLLVLMYKTTLSYWTTCLQTEIEFVIVPVCILHVSYLAHVWRNKYGDSAKRVLTICGVRKCQRNVNRLIGYLARVGCIKTQKHPSDADSTYKYLLVDCGFCTRNGKMADLVQIYFRGLSWRNWAVWRQTWCLSWTVYVVSQWGV